MAQVAPQLEPHLPQPLPHGYNHILNHAYLKYTFREHYVSTKGAFTFVLHSHLPYVRLAGRWPHGEEWIHEAATETYIPLLKTLFDLKDQGIAFRLTIGITPVLAEQLSDETVLENLDNFLEEKIKAAQRDMRLFEPENVTSINGDDDDAHGFVSFVTEEAQPAQDLADPHLHYLAGWYKSYYEAARTIFNEQLNRDIIGAFRQLQDDGYIEIMTSAATHGYLPLLNEDGSIRGQIKTALRSYERIFGKKPTAFWLPECAYRPAYYDDENRKRPGLEAFLAEEGIRLFFSETHAITGGQPVGVAAGNVIGPYGEIKRRYVIPTMHTPLPPRQATTFQPYYVSDTLQGPASQDHSGVAVIGRNHNTGQQVWSAEWGYPGDFDYREFHKKAGSSGLQYWRVTGAKVDLEHKDAYHPDWAQYKVDQHAEHFAHLVGDLIRDYHQKTQQHGLIAASYDAELFGHWWFEGVTWLGKVLHHLAQDGEVALMTASEYLATYPPQETLHLPEGSWGTGGTHFTWENGETYWMWKPIHEAEARMAKLAADFDAPTEDEAFVLAQAAREVLLMQSSDWPFQITTGQAREYAIQRFSQHVERFKQLALSLEEGRPNRANAAALYELDNVFPDIDYRDFRA